MQFNIAYEDGRGEFSVVCKEILGVGALKMAIGIECIKNRVWQLHHRFELKNVKITGIVNDDEVVEMKYVGEIQVVEGKTNVCKT